MSRRDHLIRDSSSQFTGRVGREAAFSEPPAQKSGSREVPHPPQKGLLFELQGWSIATSASARGGLVLTARGGGCGISDDSHA